MKKSTLLLIRTLYSRLYFDHYTPSIVHLHQNLFSDKSHSISRSLWITEDSRIPVSFDCVQHQASTRLVN